ncbi:hypothetical protein BGX38DRAFT_1191461, partial [Terfezia claveryi]
RKREESLRARDDPSHVSVRQTERNIRSSRSVTPSRASGQQTSRGRQHPTHHYLPLLHDQQREFALYTRTLEDFAKSMDDLQLGECTV